MYVSSSAYLASGRRGSRSPVHINQPMHCRGSPSIQSIDFTVHLFSRPFAYQSTSARLASGRRGSRSSVHIVRFSPSISFVEIYQSIHFRGTNGKWAGTKNPLFDKISGHRLQVLRPVAVDRVHFFRVQGSGFGVKS